MSNLLCAKPVNDHVSQGHDIGMTECNTQSLTSIPLSSLGPILPTVPQTSVIPITVDAEQFDTNSSSLPALSAYLQPAYPMYLHNHPEIMEAVQQMHHSVAEWQPPSPDGHFEIEARFGRWNGTFFQNGVSKSFIQKVQMLFGSFPDWWKVTDWEESHDYFFLPIISDTPAASVTATTVTAANATTKPSDLNKNLTPAPAQPLIRTTAHFQTDPQTKKRTIVREHIKKITKVKYNLKYVDLNQSSATMFVQDTPMDCRYDVRVALCFEQTVKPSELASVVNPNLVRIKSRKSYYFKSDSFPCSEPLWRFDVTYSWAGGSKSEAELKQRAKDTTYELELECLNPKAVMMMSPKHDTFYVLCSMLLKLKDFVAPGTQPARFKWELIPFYGNDE
jgi:hypothetical protein